MDMSDNSFTFSLPEMIDVDLRSTIEVWNSKKNIARIWNKDASVWTNSDEANWLGWLNIPDEELADVRKYRELRADVEQARFKDILLMGMGGSSLCPEVLAITFGKENFHILDSTVPSQVKAVEDKLEIAKTLFIVASKSGSTLEPNCFKQYFFDRVSQVSGEPGKQFIAITDPGSKMEQVAREDGFRHIIYGKPDVGGRFSALSAFGMTAAAVMGLDVAQLLRSASEMAASCRNDAIEESPGAMLGLILGVCHAAGRDKLAIFTSPDIYDLGAWLEQLVAESTGKNGLAIIPVDREPMQPAVSYGSDRIFVQIRTNEDSGLDLSPLFAAGHPVVEIVLGDLYDLGAEFFRWEFATAVAGAAMRISPFNQPDVESAKIETRKITDEYEKTGAMPDETPFFETESRQLFTSPEYAARLSEMTEEKTVAEYLSAHFANIEEGDYFALLAYIEMNEANENALARLRSRVLEKYLPATCLGFGPRFLHSTGQAYKGGANNGVFLQITADDAIDLPIPGQKYTFGVVKVAQARGDFQVLLERGRRALRVHLTGEVKTALEALADLV